MIAFVTLCLELFFALGLKVGLYLFGLKVGYLTCLLFVTLYISMNRLSTFAAIMKAKEIDENKKDKRK